MCSYVSYQVEQGACRAVPQLAKELHHLQNAHHPTENAADLEPDHELGLPCCCHPRGADLDLLTVPRVWLPLEHRVAAGSSADVEVRPEPPVCGGCQ